MKAPRSLRPGAVVALVAPAGPVAVGVVERAVARVQAFGWTPRVGRHAASRCGYLAGRDAERLADLAWALTDPEIDAVWFLRGGYGSMRLLDRLEPAWLRQRPRLLVGFSDTTALHAWAQRAGVRSVHGPHAGGCLAPWAETWLATLLQGGTGVLPSDPEAPPPRTLRPGVAEGRLVGGNLSLVGALLGTPWAVRARRAILVLEEVGEPLYRLDRLLTQLRLAGVLRSVAGVAVGRITQVPDADEAAVEALLRDRLGDLAVPVVWHLPFGHVDGHAALPLGARARLDATAGRLVVLEPVARP